MSSSIRQMESEDKICQQSLLPILEPIVPREQVIAALHAEQAFEQRERQFNMVAVVYLLIALSLFPRKSIQHVIATVWHPLRQLFPVALRQSIARIPGASACTDRRYQLKARVLGRLFRCLCRTLA